MDSLETFSNSLCASCRFGQASSRQAFSYYLQAVRRRSRFNSQVFGALWS